MVAARGYTDEMDTVNVMPVEEEACQLNVSVVKVNLMHKPNQVQDEVADNAS